MKKTLKIFLFTLLAAVSLCAFAGAEELSGECGADGGNVTWHLNTESGVLTISGSGDMMDYGYPYYSICQEQAEAVKQVVVEEGVTSIGNLAFGYDYKNIVSVTLPKSLTGIGRLAFKDCVSLAEINLPERLQIIEGSAFEGCSALTKMIIPDSVAIIESSVFSGCSSLAEVKLPAWLGIIEADLFSGCAELTSVVVPSRVAEICGSAFGGCSKIHTLYLPKSLSAVKIWAFSGMKRLQTVYYAGTAEEWEKINFGYENDEIFQAQVIFGWVDDSQPELPKVLSGECGAEGGNVRWTLENSVLTISGQGKMELFSEKRTPWYGYRDEIKAVVVEQGVTYISNDAFMDCAVVSVELAESVTTFGRSVFANCTALENVNLPSTIRELGDGMFKNCTALKEIEIPAGVVWIGDAVFKNCTALEEIVIPGNVRRIGQGAFAESGIRHISIPATVEKIDVQGFQNCAALETLELCSGDTQVRASAFENCTALKELVLPADAWLEKWSFMGCTALERVECLGPVRFEDTVYEGDCVFVFADCTSLREVVFSPYQEDLCIGIFSGCTALENVVLPEALRSVSDYAFSECTALKEIEIPDGVMQIKDNAFCNCTALVKVTIPGTVTEIQESAFQNCAALTGIALPFGLREISSNCFADCTALAEIEIPGGVTVIRNKAFMNCVGLKELMLPDAVQTIAYGAFANCTALTAIRIPAAVTAVEEKAFYSTALQTVYYGGTAEQWAAVDMARADLPAGVQMQFGHRWEPSVQMNTSGKCGVGVKWNFDGESGVLTISGSGTMTDYATWDATPWSVWSDRVKTVVVEQGVAAIGDYAFSSCRDTLERVEIAEGVERIGAYAFAYCRKLTEFYMPDSVTEVGECLLIGCEGLQTARVGKGMKLLQSSMFQDCTSLTSVEIPESVEEISHGVFLDCASLKEVKLPAAVRWFGFQAFGGKIGLEKVYYGGTAEKWKKIEQYWLPGAGTGNWILDDIEIVYEWKGEAEELPTVSGQLSGGVSGATVEIGGTKTDVNADGSFSIPAGAEAFDVVIKTPGALTYTVKNVSVSGGSITLPKIVPVKGDTNGDDMINIMDMAAFRQNFGKVGAAVQNPYTDTNGDGMVNIMDMGTFRQNFGKTAAKDCTVLYGA